MSIKMSCPQCRQVAAFKDSSAGKPTKCRKCGNHYRILTTSQDSTTTDSEDWELLARLERQAKPTHRKPRPSTRKEDAPNVFGYLIGGIGKLGGLIVSLFSVRLIVTGLACLGVTILCWLLSTGANLFDFEAASARRAQDEARRIARQFALLKPGMMQPDVESSLGVGSLREFKSTEMIKLIHGLPLAHDGRPNAFDPNQPQRDKARIQVNPKDYKHMEFEDGDNQLIIPGVFWFGQNSNQRFYQVLTASEIKPPVAIPGEPNGDFWDREKAYNRSLGRINSCHYFICLQYNAKKELTEAIALSIGVAIGPMQEKPWWNKSFLGSELLREVDIF